MCYYSVTVKTTERLILCLDIMFNSIANGHLHEPEPACLIAPSSVSLLWTAWPSKSQIHGAAGRGETEGAGEEAEDICGCTRRLLF